MPKAPLPTPTTMSALPTPQTHLMIRGAREHNLKGVDINIPKRTLTVITGVSGSGKSSLAFDTIYAEGQRRYVESLSAYARQFLQLNQKPNVEHIGGLAPAIAIEQKTTSKNPRSTVGTITEIQDYLRLLYANAGTAFCPNHPSQRIAAQTIQQMVDTVLQQPEGTRLMVLAPVVRGRKGEYTAEWAHWLAQGYQRAEVNGTLVELTDPPKLAKTKKHDISLVIDRLAVKPDNQQRLADSLATALKLAEGLAIVVSSVAGTEVGSPRQLFSEQHSCTLCGHTTQLEPRLFSFNSPFGACPTCDGLGEVIFFSPDLVVPNPALNLLQGALHPWAEKGGLNKTGHYYLSALSKHYKIDLATPWQKLPEVTRHMLLHGSGTEEIPFVFEGSKAQFITRKTYDGLLKILQRRWDDSSNPYHREDLNRYRTGAPCPDCHGARLKPAALAVVLPNPATPKATLTAETGLNLHQFCLQPIGEAIGTVQGWQAQLTGAAATIATPILREIVARLGFLQHVGLGYLNLARAAGTLSGGEAQRIRLASQIGSGLTGVLYVLDEPSIGLHQRDNARLLESLQNLRDLDNTVLVVEHDEDAIRQADHVIDMGPLAGELGGELVAAGSVADLMAEPRSITGQFLSGKRGIAVPKQRRATDAAKQLSVHGATGNNLRNLSVSFPVGVLTCITGVSGSGKSTLVMDTLHTALAAQLNEGREQPAPHARIGGMEHFDKLVNIDQSPIGRTPRSNPATYTGLYGPIRDWFAGLPESLTRGYGPGRFSFNVKGGRCEACEGDGVIKVDMQFLPDVYVPCEVCNGKRFNRETLQVQFQGHSIAAVLDMTVAHAAEVFANIPPIAKKLKTLQQVGLGYIRLGQAATTLSGGEAQRVKLAKELSKVATGRTLYILDEPTTGLHFADIEQLLGVLHKLVDAGNTMLIIEHNLDVIKTADWVVDIGPEGGSGGGQLVAQGTPEQVAANPKSITGQFLGGLLGQTRAAAKAKPKAAKH